MLTEDDFNVPEIDALLDSLQELLEGFDPTSLTYLDRQGSWQKNPSETRDRTSNELWFQIWEAGSVGGDPGRVRDLLSPLLQDRKHWLLARTLSRRAPGADLLRAFEFLSFAVEYETCRKNGDAYVVEWDSRGKAKRVRYQQESEKLLDELRKTEEPGLDTFFKLNELLKADEEGIFNKTVLIIGEEEKLREDLQLLLGDLRDSRRKDEVRDFISDQLNLSKGAAVGTPHILLRPCLEILADPQIDVSTGMQFEASGIIGKLRDVRSTDSLLAALETYDLRYTDLRANIVYALGNLKQNKALASFARVLDGPDSVKVRSSVDSEYDQSTRAEKCEAIWALGKLGPDAIEAIPTLLQHAATTDREARLYLAWAMGMIGRSQKEKRGGIDEGVLTTLMGLLTAKQSGVFEEVAFALRELGLPDVPHKLYLRDLATVPILSLKPSSTGLYELSETLLHLASIKKTVVMAVTGDSGTGKTYFCQTIANGFSRIRAHEILYLMRDRVGDRTLDRILGIRWLRKHNAAQFCEGYPLAEDEDNPEEFFDDFMRRHADKKLIILDGWRDHAYFHQVVRTFYEKGYLDVLVKFQTTFSTRRINLEEREGVLEKVKLHLPLVEDPAIEETPFYKEGAVLIYNLDNSIPSRLNREEMLQVFERKKVDTWADQIRIGRFTKGVRPLRIDDEVLQSHVESVAPEIQQMPLEGPVSFSPGEATFSRILNENIDLHPNLLQSVRLDSLSVNRAAFYTHGQLACCGYDGNVAILTGLNDRALYAKVHDTEVVDLAVIGGDIYSLDKRGELKVTSFYKNTTATVGRSDSPALSLASHRDGLIATGHADGIVRLWNMQAKTVTLLKAHAGPVLSLAIDRQGRVYSGGQDLQLRLWDVEAGTVRVFLGHGTPITAINIYPDGRIVTGTQAGDVFEKGEPTPGAKIRMVDAANGQCSVMPLCDSGVAAAINVYFDGRLFVGIGRPAGDMCADGEARTGGAAERIRRSAAGEEPAPGRVIVLDPRPDSRCCNALEGHSLETRDCVTMGPRLITCGSERESEHTLRIWGTVSYVAIEHEKLRLMSEATGKPPYYRSLF
ncbi:MAG: hypothetical protein NTX17_05425 [Candidatus Eisenbacteria bacterium]|nr:hypothetical protein [Candidatus Eisenbacteria bacterium]